MNDERTTEPHIGTDLAALLADGRPFLRCACGFLAVSNSATDNESALSEHPCPNGSVAPGGVEAVETSWLGHVFSFWGLVLVAMLVYAVLMGIGAFK